MRVMGHRYRYIFEDLANQRVEVFSSSKERARLSAEAFVEGFFDGKEEAAAVQVKDGSLRPDSPELKKLLIEKERTPEYERKARGDFAHLVDAFCLTEIGQLRELGDVIISNKVHDLPLPFTDRADELAKEASQSTAVGDLEARLLQILAVNRHNVFIPGFADAVGLELWASRSDSGAPSLWVGFSTHHYYEGKIDADEDSAGAFAEGIKTTLGDAEPSPYELSAKFGEGNVVSLADLSRYSHLVLNEDL
ncbi:hypothetical protein FOL46_007325 [Perkinsus olseni]|uniref:Uncharacterized protein n=1 Tax=Perkinsus olseni TaxID=32597 RepID=A0A7J6MQA6_PEROL|nr:hypothetical protein FOL46_007325 [Perkinsus olseni]